MSSMMTHYMEHKMEKLDIPSIPEFVEMIADTGAGLYACKASRRPVRAHKDDLIHQVQGHHHRRRVLREGRWRRDHLHVTRSTVGSVAIRTQQTLSRCTPTSGARSRTSGSARCSTAEGSSAETMSFSSSALAARTGQRSAARRVDHRGAHRRAPRTGCSAALPAVRSHPASRPPRCRPSPSSQVHTAKLPESARP